MGGLVKRSFSLSRHRTSVALEAEFWEVLTELAASAGRTLAALVTEADAARGDGERLASRLRVLALESVRAQTDTKPPT